MGKPKMGLFPEMVMTTPRYDPGKVCQGGPKGGLQKAILGSFLTKIDPPKIAILTLYSLKVIGDCYDTFLTMRPWGIQIWVYFPKW